MSENIDFKRGCIQKHPLFFAVDSLKTLPTKLNFNKL